MWMDTHWRKSHSDATLAGVLPEGLVLLQVHNCNGCNRLRRFKEVMLLHSNLNGLQHNTIIHSEVTNMRNVFHAVGMRPSYCRFPVRFNRSTRVKLAPHWDSGRATMEPSQR